MPEVEEQIQATEQELTALRGAGEFQRALDLIDKGLSQVFAPDGMPEDSATPCLLCFLATQKGFLFRELQTIGRVDPNQADEIEKQLHSWFQLALAAGERALNAQLNSRDLFSRFDQLRRIFLDWDGAPIEFLRILSGQLWRIERFDGVEDLLYVLVDRAEKPDHVAAIQAEIKGFYESLLAQSDQRLEAGGLPRPEILEALAQLTATMTHDSL